MRFPYTATFLPFFFKLGFIFKTSPSFFCSIDSGAPVEDCDGQQPDPRVGQGRVTDPVQDLSDTDPKKNELDYNRLQFFYLKNQNHG